MIVIAFLIFRAVMLWYWKVDRIVSNQEQQIATMSAILRKLEGWKDEDTNGDSSIMDK
ncbi:hypothetical protein G5B30_16725 [Sphingobacterium sp. SGG-5]|uniref:hypothetical protein n=1 Tax=Sphingobacterium sp. SGG-5 TaxID=2710881 RepID=UPI0013EA0FDE|nr:hypothetical protein [Sphingobacterium sp. SGG-5]NGM63555.1 hypothetical protein [Sphingobacterium sp. SGG-5]